MTGFQETIQTTDDSEGHFLRVRGLPWTATKDDILKFFHDSKIVNSADGIHMTLARGGRPSGECYVEFESEDDLNTAFKKHKHNMGHRYVEIFKSERSEMEWVCRKNQASDSSATGFVWLRGIPFGCSKEEIAQFFAGLKIVPNGITLPMDDTGRSTGEAFVQFASKEIAEKAMGKHKEKIGHRYIEIFQSSLQEVRNSTQKPNPRMRSGMGGGRPGPYSRNDRFGDGNGGGRYGGGSGGGGGMGRSRNMKSYYDDDMYNDYGDNYGGGYMGSGGGSGGSGGGGNGGGRFGGGGRQGMGGSNRSGGRRNEFGGGGGGMGGGGRGMNEMASSPHMVHMRGLPFRATEQDVADFFSPIPISDIFVKYGSDGRASGKADVAFYNHQDAVKAMDKDKQNMQHRYVELFLESENDDMDGGDFGGGNMSSNQGMGDDFSQDNCGGGYGSGGGGGGGFQGGRRMIQQNDFNDGNQYGGDDIGYGNMGGGNMGGSSNGYRSTGGGNFGGSNSMFGSGADDGYRTNLGQDQAWSPGQQQSSRQPPVNSNTTRRMGNMGGSGAGSNMGGGMGSNTMGGMGGGMGNSGGFDRGYRTSGNQSGYTEF